MKKTVVEIAEDAVRAAAEQVIQQGGVVHEDARWDAHEAALDGASPEALVETINGTRKGPYKPKGGFVPTVGRN